MWYVKAFLVLVVIVVVLLFAIANSEQQVVIRWWNPDGLGTPINLALALFAAFVLGVLTFFIVSAIREARWRQRCARLQRELEKVRAELNALRTAPLEGPLGGAAEIDEPSNEEEMR